MKRLTREEMTRNWTKVDPEAIIRWHRAYDVRHCSDAFYDRIDSDLAEWEYGRMLAANPVRLAHEQRYQRLIRRNLARLDRIREDMAHERAEKAAARKMAKIGTRGKGVR